DGSVRATVGGGAFYVVTRGAGTGVPGEGDLRVSGSGLESCRGDRRLRPATASSATGRQRSTSSHEGDKQEREQRRNVALDLKAECHRATPCSGWGWGESLRSTG